MTHRFFAPNKFLVCLLLCFLSNCEPSLQSMLAELSIKLPEDGLLNYTGLSTKYGHPADEYDVITEDGYILTIFRHPGSKPPVLLIHGQGDTGDTFILRGRQSLAITLAEEGHEVWTGNTRGNKYARRHVQLDPDIDSEYWDYSFHEIGYYDLAAMIDFVCNKTGRRSIAVIGHSQGSTAQFVLTSMRPEYNARITIGIELAPGAFYKYAVYPIAGSALLGPIFNAVMPKSVHYLFTDGKLPTNFIKLACTQGFASYLLCMHGFFFPYVGFNPFGIGPEFSRIMVGHYPATVSRKGLLHYDQVLLRKRFSLFDYGSEKNMERYGRATPPDYNLKAVTMPTALFAGRNDRLVRLKDVRDLKAVLPHVVHFEIMKPILWNHLDFVWGSQMPVYLFPSIFQLLKKYNT